MQIFVKTLKGTHFEIEVKPDATIADVKKNIETSQGQSVYPADQQMLIHQGKVLKDETTLAENNVADKTFIVVMLRKAKASSSGTSTTTVTPLSQKALANQPVSVAVEASGRAFQLYQSLKEIAEKLKLWRKKEQLVEQKKAEKKELLCKQSSMWISAEKLEQKVLEALCYLQIFYALKYRNLPLPASSASANPPVSSQAPGALTAPASVTVPVGLTAPALASISPTTTAAPAPMTAAPAPMTAAPVPTPAVTASDTADAYDQAASNLVAGNNLEQAIQQIIDMGGGTWDRETVVRAMRAAFNNPERAVEYLYFGIPEQAEVTPPVSRSPTEGQAITNPPPQAPQSAQTAIPSRGPNANPLNLFPQGLPSMGGNTAAGNLDFLRNSPQFRALQAMVQANPQILQPMLQELGRQNPQIMRLIQDHQAEFLRLINEPAEGGESNLLGQLGSSMPHALTVTPEEREAIERLEAMGFNRSLVLEAYFACNKNEELAANYLLDHMHEFDDNAYEL